MSLDYTTVDLLAPVIVMVSAIGVCGWILNNWMRMRHGYPLENSWGKAIYPKRDDEAQGRIQLLTQENAQLRAEMGSVKDRLAVVERIVTDQGFDVARQIEALRVSGRDGKTN
ncbi:hypothetical protein [Novosphingobium album (ex Liu et al. 2023)]|uniref:Uncharacterized protein n=1 Tax=Novosphingobium album (ex Liu et al. 2023) TaxID=3031130 RepID=A0ABT5WSQ9_9SPHN|nr:hypothetical protein [Novosphingobium album (ex Liu et al. 2023)]MDE8653077.1 hypothetical protein [Novosphingobium album (ex Liu et al. 2023)]